MRAVLRRVQPGSDDSRTRYSLQVLLPSLHIPSPVVPVEMFCTFLILLQLQTALGGQYRSIRIQLKVIW